MPHSVKPGSGKQQYHTSTSYRGNQTGNGAVFATHLGSVQATSMMQVWNEERDPAKLTFTEGMALRGSLVGGADPASSASSSSSRPNGGHRKKSSGTRPKNSK